MPPLASNSNDLAGLGAGRDQDRLRFRRVSGTDLAAKGGLGDGDVQRRREVRAFAREPFVLGDAQMDVQVAHHSAAQCGSAFTGDPQRRTAVDAPVTSTVTSRIPNSSTLAATDRTW